MATQFCQVTFEDFIREARRYGHPTMAIQFDGEPQAFMQLGIDSEGDSVELVVSPLTKEQVVELVGEYQANAAPVLPCGPNV
ncbi:hypothetical protein NH8B_2272 [Pseudogulbenkiania sp. NH8B]|uniref:hypothetical protein n=1 Tax=Pseudogulbenkiania sp. (strain NH8B) TaxID=748280 RepID=UPI0002279D96|nr:hypothetical protein [Pseudogulbenkiania sp. NH8B]BAK77086.1 hypothetical protein NH8B_2272 [Pseudogulbenkiania sp. NH8B]